VAVQAFKSWWKEIRSNRDSLSDPHAAARDLGQRLDALGHAERGAFFSELMDFLLQQRHAYGVVLFLLERVSDQDSLRTLAEHMVPLPGQQADDEEAHLADLMRILGATNEPSLMVGVEAYLLERPICSYWSSVPWALWPHRPELFASAWARFFADRQPECYEDTLVLRSFLGEPDAISAVQAELSANLWDPLRVALLGQVKIVRWLSEKQRAELQRNLK
jgi:hypothetical protein